MANEQKKRIRLTSAAATLLFLFFGLQAYAQEKDSLANDSRNGIVVAGTDDSGKKNQQHNKGLDSVPPYYYRFNRAYLNTYPYDLGKVITAPARWKGRDWARFGAVVGITGISMAALDKPVRSIVLHNRNNTLTRASQVFYPLGNRFPPLLLTGMYLTGVIFKDRRTEHASLAITKALAVSTVVYTASKSVVRRQRPTRTDNPHEFVAPFSKDGFTSFPSGHTNTAFAVATAFALEYKDKKWVPWVAYPLASLTAISRMYDDRHWLSDVLVGAAMGHFVTRAVYRLEEKRKEAKRTNLKAVF